MKNWIIYCVRHWRHPSGAARWECEFEPMTREDAVAHAAYLNRQCTAPYYRYEVEESK